MFGPLGKLSFALVLVTILFCLMDLSEANYKNAPMNGIMFGKRGPSGKYKILFDNLRLFQNLFTLIIKLH